MAPVLLGQLRWQSEQSSSRSVPPDRRDTEGRLAYLQRSGRSDPGNCQPAFAAVNLRTAQSIGPLKSVSLMHRH
jgi:hypothetical protein